MEIPKEQSEAMNYKDFFRKATQLSEDPYDYQERLATDLWPDVLNVSTGLGKTAAVTLAWIYKRYELRDSGTPRRLIWCLPMRVLAEQTQRSAQQWLERLGFLGSPGEPGKVSVHLMMGGEENVRKATWAEHPESDQILIGTQDMLLSRALMRGYGMSRFQWPVHFSLLHNDALWVYDEVQLMGSGLQTSAQLEAFRRAMPCGLGSRSLWMSATLNRDWLATVDFRFHIEKLSVLELTKAECASDSVRRRRESIKRLSKEALALTADNAKSGATAYVRTLAESVLMRHQRGTQTVVILNTVERAQSVFEMLEESRPGIALLVHSRFRQKERAEINDALIASSSANEGRIVVATQAIEAGVDITSRMLFTELAPWASLVQRFGRCNRYGEWNDTAGADIFWIDVTDELAGPYGAADLVSARNKLESLSSASPANLPSTDEASPLVPILRRRDFLDLFNTDPDLSGFDTDIAPYIRDADDLDVQVFWRTEPEVDAPQPLRNEICRASLSQLKRYLDKRKGEDAAWRWDALDGKWKKFRDSARPGLVLMLDAALGGYDERIGFTPDQIKHPVTTLVQPASDAMMESYSGDHRSYQNRPIELVTHLGNVESEARTLATALGMPLREAEAVARAGCWHDVGKAHEVFRSTMTNCGAMTENRDRLWAKSPCSGRHSRRHFRHELASMLAWVTHRSAEPDSDLIAYLIAAHHGKVRMSLRAMPDEKSPADANLRFARGVWEGDRLPAMKLPGDEIEETELCLDLMEIGEGEMGPSWTERTQRLLEEYGPFRLAWLETLVRLADWRASRSEQTGVDKEDQV